MNRESKRSIYYAARTLDVGWGAAFGKLKPEVNDCVIGIKKDFNNLPNPREDLTFNSMVCDIDSFDNQLLSSPENWKSVSWANKVQRSRSLERFFLTSIAFSDDHSSSLHHEFLPKEQALKFQDLVIDAAKKRKSSLNLSEQFKISLNLTAGNPLDASVVAFFGSRAIARNHDQRVDRITKKFTYTNDDLRLWSRSVSYFDMSAKFDSIGDTYHWWTCCSMGMIIRACTNDESVKSEVVKRLFENGASIMVFLRKQIAHRELNFVHADVDNQGLRVGWKIADHYLSK